MMMGNGKGEQRARLELGVLVTTERGTFGGEPDEVVVVEAGGEGDFVGEWSYSIIREAGGRYGAWIRPPSRSGLSDRQLAGLARPLGPFESEAEALSSISEMLLASLVLGSRRLALEARPHV